MSEMTMADNRYSLSGKTVERLSLGLSLAGVLAAALTVVFSRSSVPIERPWLLAAASGFLLVPMRRTRVVLLQKVIGVYLIGVLFNQIFNQYVMLSIMSHQISVSRSVGPFVLCALGSILTYRRPNTSAEASDQCPFLCAWLIAFVVLLAHMLFLVLLLHRFYGYGYENDFYVLAHLAFCFLLFLTLWGPLGHGALRVLWGVILMASYVALELSP